MEISSENFLRNNTEDLVDRFLESNIEGIRIFLILDKSIRFNGRATLKQATVAHSSCALYISLSAVSISKAA